jgi:hypothetical protein
MAFFGSRIAHPMDEREQALNEEIARLEKEIAGLKSPPAKSRRERSTATTQTAKIGSDAEPSRQPGSPLVTQVVPQVLSTEPLDVPVMPVPLPPTPPLSLQTIPVPATSPIVQKSLTTPAITPVRDDPHYNDLGERKFDVKAWWSSLQSQLRRTPYGPANPEMVKYLATGSVQGLRPLRYERRVARNRTIALVAVLVVILYGLAWVFLRR